MYEYIRREGDKEHLLYRHAVKILKLGFNTPVQNKVAIQSHSAFGSASAL
jgi:hypothetical protein